MRDLWLSRDYAWSRIFDEQIEATANILKPDPYMQSDTSTKDVIISPYAGGLGDNLCFSTLPEMYARTGFKVLIGRPMVAPNIRNLAVQQLGLGPALWAGRLILFYPLTKRHHELNSPLHFHRRDSELKRSSLLQNTTSHMPRSAERLTSPLTE